MSQISPSEPGSEQPATQDPSLLPPEPPAAPTWAPVPPPPARSAGSMWSQIAAYVLLIAVVALGIGAGIGWGLARTITSHQIAQQTNNSPSSPITQVTPGTGPSSSIDAIAA